MIRKIKVTKDFDSKNPIIVVGNMNDLADDQRQVTEAEATKFCQEQGLPFTEASAKSGLNIEKIFGLLIGEWQKLNHREGAKVDEKVQVEEYCKPCFCRLF